MRLATIRNGFSAYTQPAGNDNKRNAPGRKNYWRLRFWLSASPAGFLYAGFLVGAGLARSVSVLNNIPLWLISHQENHLLAGKWSAGGPDDERFLFLHASGGTTDLLTAEKTAAAVIN